jgi:hypothetical protein
VIAIADAKRYGERHSENLLKNDGVLLAAQNGADRAYAFLYNVNLSYNTKTQ